MNALRYLLIACLFFVALTANARIYKKERLRPTVALQDECFAVTVRSWKTGDNIHFSITVTPKKSEFFLKKCQFVMVEDEGMVELVSQEDQDPGANELPNVYDFECASRFLPASQFIFRYSRDKNIRNLDSANAIWFYLKDFAPAAALNVTN